MRSGEASNIHSFKNNNSPVINALIKCGFGKAYVARNADLQEHGLSETEAVQHFLEFGHRERRVGGMPAPGAITELLQATVNDANRGELLRAVAASALQLAGETNDGVQSLADELVAALSIGNASPYVIFGDSHSTLYFRPVTIEGHYLVPIRIVCSGGSALGLANPNSKSGYRRQLLEWINTHLPIIESGIPFFFKFGQVDAEFVSVFDRIRKNEKEFISSSFESFSSKSADAYFSFLNDVSQIIPKSQIHVCSIFPPTLSDACWSQGYVNAHIGFLEGDRGLEELEEGIRLLDKPSYKTRVSLHSSYNAAIRNRCACAGYIYVDDFTPLLDRDGLVQHQYLINHNGSDHHFKHESIANHITSTIIKYI